ncbi:isochorismatase family protein [Streptomyces sp. GbtcB6]|uniref:isochorismatase family protein n=1 Tax=Streptomyces sp. GbtcB6 TaxID=2824751 RepID=UPI001C30202B|nr:isochorismatase family protein [Streptomyces sp. GbtcB6]
MDIELRTPQNTAIVLVDYATGYANLIRTQSITANVTGAVALARMAIGYGMPLVVTTGPERDPRGTLYPELKQEIGDTPVVHRGGGFDAFFDSGFEQAIEATGVRHLVIAGLTTDGCVLRTSVGALQRGLGVTVVADASASASQIQHDAAVGRLTQLGVSFTTWLSLAAEIQVTYDNEETVGIYRSIQVLDPSLAKNFDQLNNALRLGAAG